MISADRPRPARDWVALAFWYVGVGLGVVAIVVESRVLLGVGGASAAVFGLALASNFGGLASRETGRGAGIGPFRTYQSPAMLRLIGFGILVIGFAWAALAFSGQFEF